LLVLVELVSHLWSSRRDAKRFFVDCVLPMTPGTLLAIWSVGVQVLAPAAIKLVGYRGSIWLPPWDLAYNLWAEWFWAFTNLSLPTIVPCIVLAVIAWRRRAEHVPLFGPAAFLVLVVLYAIVPYRWSYWAYASTRIAPFLWLAALARVPEKLPRWLAVTLGACTLAYSLSLGIDYVRLDREQKEFTAGIPHVPRGARLLPLVFTSKGISVNTHPLMHSWGYYVVDKETAAPGVFATSWMFGVTYRVAPHPQFVHTELERFVGYMRDPSAVCRIANDEPGIHVGDCEQTWRDDWAAFWKVAEPQYDWLLLWDPKPITETLIPLEYKTVFHEGRLTIMHRD
jgi:hypothetical protein